jgi:hypothetical protein
MENQMGKRNKSRKGNGISLGISDITLESVASTATGIVGQICSLRERESAHATEAARSFFARCGDLIEKGIETVVRVEADKASNTREGLLNARAAAKRAAKKEKREEKRRRSNAKRRARDDRRADEKRRAANGVPAADKPTAPDYL